MTNPTDSQPVSTGNLFGIDYMLMIQKVWKQKWPVIGICCVVFVLTAVYMFSQPRFYTTQARLTPEVSGRSGVSGSLGGMASMLGLGGGSGAAGADAIGPSLYPELMEDNAFVADLFNVVVTTEDGEVTCDYKTYMKYHQKTPWWASTPNPEDENKIPTKPWWKFWGKDPKPKEERAFNPYRLDFKDDMLMKVIRKNIKLEVDKKTGVISIDVIDQDPVVCATIADSLSAHYQQFITRYRTSKARIDVEHYKQLMDQALVEYDQAIAELSASQEANYDAILPAVMAEQQKLQGNLAIKQSTYTALNQQYQAAMAKLQEETPAFTQLKGAAVPVLPAGPKRGMTVLGMTFLAFLACAAWILREEIKQLIASDDEES